MKLNLGSGRFPLDGFVNVDEYNWRAEECLREFADEQIEAITISHMLMYLPIEVWPPFFAGVHRVLGPDGVLRVTEDDTAHPDTTRPGVQPGAATATSPKNVGGAMLGAGFVVVEGCARTTLWKDLSLMQRFHGDPPDVFFLEGVKARP